MLNNYILPAFKWLLLIITKRARPGKILYTKPYPHEAPFRPTNPNKRGKLGTLSKPIPYICDPIR